MDELDYWRLCDELTVIQAALLIVGIDPSSNDGAYADGWKPHEQPAGYMAAKSALCHAVASRKLRARMRHDAEPRYVAGRDNFDERARWQGEDVHEVTDFAGDRFVVTAEADWSKTTIAVDDLRAWLTSRGVRTGFFFPTAPDAPDYLDPTHARYAPKLAAAVRAWLAVQDPQGKHPKQALMKWLRENAAEFGLSDEEGKPNEQGIEECAKVANWQPGGGAPKTPGA